MEKQSLLQEYSMAVNKVIYGTETLLDLTDDTVTENDLLKGVTAHSKSGDQISGTLGLKRVSAGTSDPSVTEGEDGDIYLVI